MWGQILERKYNFAINIFEAYFRLEMPAQLGASIFRCNMRVPGPSGSFPPRSIAHRGKGHPNNWTFRQSLSWRKKKCEKWKKTRLQKKKLFYEFLDGGFKSWLVFYMDEGIGRGNDRIGMELTHSKIVDVEGATALQATLKMKGKCRGWKLNKILN